MVSTDSVLSYDIQITTKISLFTELRLEISYVWVQKSLSFVDIFQISYAGLDILAIPLRAHIYPPLHFQNIVGKKKCWKFSHRPLRYSVLSISDFNAAQLAAMYMMAWFLWLKTKKDLMISKMRFKHLFGSKCCNILLILKLYLSSRSNNTTPHPIQSHYFSLKVRW